MNRSDALVVFSGGQDSTTCLFWAKKHFSKVYALSFVYGQKHVKEVELARSIAAGAGVEFEAMDVSFIGHCRDAFIKSLNVTLNLAMDEQFVLHTPLMWIDKAETWALADELGVLDLIRRETLTCYNGIQGDGCGHCPACKLRREGLEKYLASKK